MLFLVLSDGFEVLMSKIKNNYEKIYFDAFLIEKLF